jgi:undecaprenyl-diphosphatase
VLLGGVRVNQHKLGLTEVLILGIAGAIIGDSIGYEVGKRYGVRLLTHIPDRLLDEEKLEKSQDLMRRLGGKAVFVGRFTVAARVLIPGLAGMSRLPYPRFLAFNVAGGAIWATGFVLLGYAVGSQYKSVEHNASLVGYGIIGLVVAYALYRYLRHRRRQRVDLHRQG